MTYHEIGYKSTRYYLIETLDGLLAFDAGWPGTYSEYRDALKAKGLSMGKINTVVVSHFHIDHAGLLGQFQKNGVECVVFPNQIEEIPDMEKLMGEKQYPFEKIDVSKLQVKDFEGSRSWLRSLGVEGEIISTPGHTPGSITLLLDSGEAFIGDLSPLREYDNQTTQDWDLLRKVGAKVLKPAHAEDIVFVTTD